jgi:hypothetical protein
MKTFRQKFTKNIYFPMLIIIYIFSALVVFPSLPTLDRSEETIWGITLTYSSILIFFTFRALFACCYITITDTEIIFINPYIRFYRIFSFSDITRAKISSGGIYAANFLQIWDKDGKRFFKEIALVRFKDLNEIVDIFEEHGIEVDKFWKGYIE